ncbi:MAG: methylmalonyl Co-A mutase-associated GTPase MeaB [Desulfuromonadales bacterium]|nr:methylmalonyl Co-A mutase-associated GTPase MeaB [Desulfuromonadales bacterium]
MRLAEKIIQGDIRAAARLITQIDNHDPAAVTELQRLYPLTGRAEIVGVTGPPGAGKSTLTDKLIGAYRQQGKKVAVVAVDPSSSFTSGAVLGDRIRMNRHATDPGVFIRSLGTRGHLGGLSRSTGEVVNVFDAMGYEVIIIETVGVGQDEVEIAGTAHTTLVVTVPGLGDDIQAIKAGVFEIADIFVVNKADRPEAEKAVRDLTTLVGMNHPGEDEWWQPVLKTVASTSEGVDQLVEAIGRHYAFLLDSGKLQQFEEQKSQRHLCELLQEELYRQVRTRIREEQALNGQVRAIARRELDPYTAARQILTTGAGLALAKAGQIDP